MRNLTISIKKGKILPVLCLIDILLLPYLRFFSCSISMLFLLGWYMLHMSYTMKQKALLGIISYVVLSLFVGFLSYNKLLGLSASVIFVFSFMLFFYYRKEYKNDIGLIKIFNKCLEVYLFIALAFAGIYTINPGLYFTLRSFWTMSGNEIDFSSRVINRFTFLFSDPNNAGCMFVAIMAYLVKYGEKNRKKQTIYMVVGSVCAIATFSVTAVGMLIGVYFLMIATKTRSKKWMLNALVFSALLIFVLTFVFYAGLIDNLLSGEMAKSLLWRIETNSKTGSTLGGRSAFWEATIDNALSWYNIFIGKGAVIDAKGIQYTPHSAHLFMLISFGLGANILFYAKLCYLGRKVQWSNYIPLIPCFAIFTINTGLTDYRFMVLYACLFAAMQTTCRKLKYRQQSG